MKYSNNRTYRDKQVIEEVKIVTTNKIKKLDTVLDKIKNIFKKR